MTEIDDLLSSAKRRLAVADHFLTQTYPMLQDPKLLLNVLDGIVNATEEMVDALIQHETEEGKIPAIADSFGAKLSLIKGSIAKKYNFTHVDIMMISEMQELLHEHRKSDVEFTRKGAYVMASKDYALSTVTLEKLKTYLNRTKTLFTKIHDGITRN